VVQELELKELNLRGSKFTWSNDRTQTRIDRASCLVDWDLMMPGVFLQALSSEVSNHYPLVVAGTNTVKDTRGFILSPFGQSCQCIKMLLLQLGQRICLQTQFYAYISTSKGLEQH
jgi:hypothetical protein